MRAASGIDRRAVGATIVKVTLAEQVRHEIHRRAGRRSVALLDGDDADALGPAVLLAPLMAAIPPGREDRREARII